VESAEGGIMSMGEWLAFVGIWFLATLPLGPNAVNCMLVTARYGVRAMAWPIVGLLVASVIFQTLVFLGIATVLTAAAGLFTLVKLAGCAYLAWLGVKLWRSDATPFDRQFDAAPSPLALVRSGCLISLSNPKAILSYAALFTQFIDAQTPILAQVALLTPTALVVLVIVYSAYALAGAPIRQFLTSARRVRAVNRAVGGFFVFTAAAIAASEVRR
jgi:threonine/homoserine/homoserine lactone efflux protein